MNDQILSIIRSALKFAGGYIVAKGITDAATVETIVGGVIAVVGLVTSWLHHKSNTTPTT